MDELGSLRHVNRRMTLFGVLQRQVTVRVVNAGLTGCLLESDVALPPGTSCSLRVTVDGDQYGDDLQVIRCTEVSGGRAKYQVGAQFLWNSQPAPGSVRLLFGQERKPPVALWGAELRRPQRLGN